MIINLIENKYRISSNSTSVNLQQFVSKEKDGVEDIWNTISYYGTFKACMNDFARRHIISTKEVQNVVTVEIWLINIINNLEFDFDKLIQLERENLELKSEIARLKTSEFESNKVSSEPTLIKESFSEDLRDKSWKMIASVKNIQLDRYEQHYEDEEGNKYYTETKLCDYDDAFGKPVISYCFLYKC